jgi:hypothetical protein
MLRSLTIGALIIGAIFVTGCRRDAEVASYNLSEAADNFEVTRRIIFYNGITGANMLELIGRCSIKDEGNQLEVTCKTGEGEYTKHFLGLSDNVTYFAEQLGTLDVSVYHYRVLWKPQQILPDIDLRIDLEELTTDQYDQ